MNSILDHRTDIEMYEVLEDLKAHWHPKPIYSKPLLYSLIFQTLREIGRYHGYNVLLSGSLNRDLDLVCIPWINKPSSHYQLLIAFDQYCNGKQMESIDYYSPGIQPGHRYSYIINLNRGGKWNNYQDQQMYLDISITSF